eukprot:scaffold5196_cov33-Tisochrysis_lutea.AAC.1
MLPQLTPADESWQGAREADKGAARLNIRLWHALKGRLAHALSLPRCGWREVGGDGHNGTRERGGTQELLCLRAPFHSEPPLLATLESCVLLYLARHVKDCLGAQTNERVVPSRATRVRLERGGD